MSGEDTQRSPEKLEDSAWTMGQIHALPLSRYTNFRWNLRNGAKWTRLVSFTLGPTLFSAHVYVLLVRLLYSLSMEDHHHHADSWILLFSPTSTWSQTSSPGHIFLICSWPTSLPSLHYSIAFLHKIIDFDTLTQGKGELLLVRVYICYQILSISSLIYFPTSISPTTTLIPSHLIDLPASYHLLKPLSVKSRNQLKHNRKIK